MVQGGAASIPRTGYAACPTCHTLPCVAVPVPGCDVSLHHMSKVAYSVMCDSYLLTSLHHPFSNVSHCLQH